ncbi:25303_t:CDS:2 [Dentiscutata erythropus]|uniref:25303_t:CDS:1 n=1 Tax=Dentiscutata erythropus TaxID=1348616 RepID=A0A9N9G1I7_9GLOM|nr:25303_t:CDS:2 [Dentiscutata erythropus]
MVIELVIIPSTTWFFRDFGGDKYISGTALYCTNNDNDIFREITFRGFTGSSDCLISLFEKNFIISLVQTISISSSDNEDILTPLDLPRSSPLLLFSVPIIQGSYHSNNGRGRESFILSKHLYNGITNSKHIPSNIIILYLNESSELQYSASNEKLTSVNFMDAIFQVCTNEHHSEPTNINPTPENTENVVIPSDPNIKSTSLSNFEGDDEITPINNIESVTTTSGNQPTSQRKGTKQSEKCLKSTKK